jgi:hypothetical protein
MNDYEQIFQRDLLLKLDECLARQARLQHLEGDIRQELTLLEKEEERIHKALIRLSTSRNLNPVSSSFRLPADELYLETEDK